MANIQTELEELSYDELKTLAQAITKDNIHAEKVFAELGRRVIYSTIPQEDDNITIALRGHQDQMSEQERIDWDAMESRQGKYGE